MTNYSVAQVEGLTGIKGHTLRVWERRYSFLEPERTETNIRYYSDQQLRQLLNIAVLIRHGIRISAIDKMSEDQIYAEVVSILENPESAVDDDINRLTIAMLELNEQEFINIFQVQIMRKGLLNTIKDLIYPFLNLVGVLWTTKKAMPAQEHFVSNLIRQKIIAAIDSLPQPTNNAPAIIMFLLEGEEHEIGLLLASYIAQDLGFRVYYLGQNVPTENILEVAEMVNPVLLLTMLVTPNTIKFSKHLNRIVEKSSIPVAASGNPENFTAKANYLKAIEHIKSPAALIDYLNSFKQ
jgi:DNA-binding transcriptional MerR regulator